jgi:hypothetical protein
VAREYVDPLVDGHDAHVLPPPPTPSTADGLPPQSAARGHDGEQGASLLTADDGDGGRCVRLVRVRVPRADTKPPARVRRSP